MDTFERGRYLIILENEKKFHSHRLLPLQQHIQPCTIFFSKKDLNRAKNQICQIPTLGRKKYRCKSSQLFLKSFLKNKKKKTQINFFHILSGGNIQQIRCAVNRRRSRNRNYLSSGRGEPWHVDTIALFYCIPGSGKATACKTGFAK